MRVELSGRQAQCVICDRVFTSDAGCERHKSYNGRGGKATCVDPASLGMVERERGWTQPLPESAKTWATSEPYVPAGPQTLTCARCGVVWERAAQRGRKPNNCISCSAVIAAEKEAAK